MTKSYAVIDVETTMIEDGKIPETLFWGYADEKGYKKFKTTKELDVFLRRLPDTKTILHHTNFDVIQALVDNSQISILKSHNGKLITSKWHKHTLLNSYAIFPIRLASIFEAFGYEKTELGKLDKRNYDDCVIGLEVFCKLDDIFNSLIGVSPFDSHTIAGTAFKAAEKIAGKMPKDLRFIDSYRGGRVEVFDLRKAKVNKYDINSSYPASFVDCPDNDYLLHVGVRTKDFHCPLFDEYGSAQSSMLLFPNGKFTSWVYKSNYEKYIEPFAENTSIKVLEKIKIDFTWIKEVVPFIETIYEKKQNSTGAIKLACKLLINSMYGRIGLRGQSERARFIDYRPDGDNLTAYRIGKRWLCFDSVLREPRSNFPFAAFITDNARARLYRDFKRHDVFYGDTDSIFTKSKYFLGCVGKNLGDWTHEGKEWFQARNVKDYIWGEKEVFKGGNGNTQWTLKRFAQGKTAQKIIKTRKTELRKRIVNGDGSTSPIVVP